MTSFQRLLRGLQVLNRYSGVTDVKVVPYDLDMTSEVHVPVSPHINVDARDQAALSKLGWVQAAPNWVFQP